MIFTVNGQSHGTLTRNFFKRAGKGYLKDSLIVLVDCSSLSYVNSEDLFKTSRDRLTQNEDSEAIEKKLLDVIKDDRRLRRLQNERHKKHVTEKVGDTKLAENVFKKILKHSPALQKFLVSGQRMPGRTHGPEKSPPQTEFVGRSTPTFFREVILTEESRPKPCQPSRSVRLQYQTDAANDYLSRSLYPGVFLFECGELPVNEWANIIKLDEGVLTLQLDVPENVTTDVVLKIECSLVDETMVGPLTSKTYIKVEPFKEKPERKNPPNPQPNPPKRGNDLQLPPINEVRRDRWKEYDFNESSALTVIPNKDSYDFFVNMDNKFLLNEIKYNQRIDKEILEYRFKFALFFLSFPLVNDFLSREFDGSEGQDQEREIEKFSKACATIVLPLINALSEADRMTPNDEED